MTSDNYRWWENYLVRYLVGNIFAVLVLFYLVAIHGDALQNSICQEKIKPKNNIEYQYDISTCYYNSKNNLLIDITKDSANLKESTTLFRNDIVKDTKCIKDLTLKIDHSIKYEPAICKPGAFSGEIFGFIFITTKEIKSTGEKTKEIEGNFLSDTYHKAHEINITEINFANIFVMGVFGFLYMYVSTIPIYFFHITRGAYFSLTINEHCNFKGICVFAFLSLFALIVYKFFFTALGIIIAILIVFFIICYFCYL